jgi:hypothetical protein
MPPLMIGEADVDEAVGLLDEALIDALAGEHVAIGRGAAAG